MERDIIGNPSKNNMTVAETSYLIPYIVSLILSVTVLFYAWGGKYANGIKPFRWYLLAQTLWIAGFILELTSRQLEIKIYWDAFQWFCALTMVVSGPWFAVEYTELKLKHPRRYFAASLLVPLIFGAILFTDPIHHFIYFAPRITRFEPFSELQYRFTPAIYLFAAYAFGLAAWTSYLLIRRYVSPQGLYRSQILAILAGFLIPVISLALATFGIQITPERDPLPFASMFSNLAIAWGISRYRLFEVAPIARDRILETMADPIVVLNRENLVVDINIAMLALLDKTEAQVIGEPAKKVFDDFPIPIKMYTQVAYARAETVFEMSGRQIHYELTVWPLFNKDKEMAGRVYICHDITAMKDLENALRKLNLQLEDRVKERTRELAEAYESMLEGLARALELRDKETEGHSRRVTENALKLAQRVGISGQELEDIRSGAILHDIGKISIPDEILHKPGKLTPEERAIVEQHPDTAYRLLSKIPFMAKAIEIPYCHHEKWDGTGYPQKLKGEQIPLAARVFAVADVWDALSNDRPYNKAWPREQIIEYFKEQTGLHFDPVIARLFLNMAEKGEI